MNSTAKFVLIFLLIVAAIVCFGIGLFAAIDPDGRGGKYLLEFWGAAAACVFLAIGVHWSVP